MSEEDRGLQAGVNSNAVNYKGIQISEKTYSFSGEPETEKRLFSWTFVGRPVNCKYQKALHSNRNRELHISKALL